jgi:hypothetical protein
MASNFPTGLDSFATLVDNVDDVLAAHMNDRGDAIENLEAKVGIDSSAVVTSHDYFLKNASGAYRTHVHDGTSDDGSVLSYRTTFTSASLTAGVLTVTHSLSQQYVQVVIVDNNGKVIFPDDVEYTSSSALSVDLGSYGTITGTWRVTVLR